ncbi:phosphoribosylamine--glycine ligase [Bacillus coahuilensis m2-6]|uniref:Phosphoribosylamine--glycine ligase n=1 Tax=Bacillus coahuilensis p1.1.43 TaxID=1150625 RepID=A0A147KC96_9BACI|nr:phosphoribosylamine--glycine ligase [Bacillus coahuilensis]KUP09230.1 phosphoribosylamine--glycine ligase [Bacillus coahuilensis p1.1.43]KUP09954.1 phosphoribosylamine--glycine ligase [Bacillus coahuilensis m2-6]
MKVLVIGSGGREHAICHKLMESESVSAVYCEPGSDAISEVATCEGIDPLDFVSLVSLVKREGIELTIVGPEAPLVAGIVDFFQENDLLIFGPTQKAAQIEGSKRFAKDLMKQYNIPTAAYETFTSIQDAKEYIASTKGPYVIKANGLAAGKGVVIADGEQEACQAVESMLSGSKFGEAGREIVIEAFLEGEEFSLMAFVNGTTVIPLEIAQDHKRVGEGDTGLNTGGMGAYSPVPQIPKSVVTQAVETIMKPVAEAMVKEGRSFTGILYGGLMLTKEGPKVIEFNARFGDPETQVVLPRLESDLGVVLKNILGGGHVELSWTKKTVVGIVLASLGYPEQYETGTAIEGLSEVKGDSYVFHSGTKKQNEEYVSSGGRVVVIGAKGEGVKEAREKALRSLSTIQNLTNFHYRKDIGYRAIMFDDSSLFEYTQTK